MCTFALTRTLTFTHTPAALPSHPSSPPPPSPHIHPHPPPHVYRSEAILAIAASGLTLLAMLLLFLVGESEKPTPLRRTFMGGVLHCALFLLWIAVVWYTTFARPFTVTGNGYFAAWFGLASAWRLLASDEGSSNLLCCVCHSMGHRKGQAAGEGRDSAVPAKVVLEMHQSQSAEQPFAPPLAPPFPPDRPDLG